MRTYRTRISDVDRQWWLIDAADQNLGRMSTHVASLLLGKHKPIFSRHLDTGDFVVVINVAKVAVTGKKTEQKLYYRHSGYPGGLKSETLGQVLETHPARAIEHSVRGMLPRNKLGDAMMKRLKVYAGAEHPHQGQLKAATVTAEKES